MSIHEKDDEIGFMADCDFCSNYLEIDEGSFQGTIKELKDSGWIIFKRDEAWMIQCPVHR